MNSEEHHGTTKVAPGDDAQLLAEVEMPKVFGKHNLTEYFHITKSQDGWKLKMRPEVEELDTKILAAVKSLESFIPDDSEAENKIIIRDLSYKAKYEAATVIKATEKLEGLHVLQADFSNQYSWVEQFFKSVSKLRKLEQLILTCSFSPLNQLPESIVNYPLNLPDLKILKIVLSHTSLNNLKYLNKCIESCTGVKHFKLSLAGNEGITTEEMQDFIAILSTFTSLEFVHLNLNNMICLTPPVLQKLGEFIENALSLQTLKLGMAENYIIEHPHTVALIESIKKNSSIKKVVINFKDCPLLTKAQLTLIHQEINALGIDSKVKSDLKKKSSLWSCQ